MVIGLDVPAMFPSNDSLTRHPLRSPGSPRVRFPCFVATTRCSDFRPPVPPAFVVLRRTVTSRAPVFVPRGPTPATRPGALLGGSPTPPFTDRRRPDLPGSWGTLVCLCPALGPQQDRRPRPFGPPPGARPAT